MISLGLIIGIYANLILFLGFAGLLYRPIISVISIVYILVVLYFFLKKKLFVSLKNSHWERGEKLLLGILAIQGLITSIGVLGPETGFDAVWYHLTLPKLFLQNHSIIHIPGGLFYYSDMPKLTEVLYTAALAFGNETIPKLIHFSFGIGTCIVLFSFAKQYMERKYALLTVLLFVSNLVVGWEAITAYIDLSRTFFELIALLLFMKWLDEDKITLFYLSAVFLGLSISTKLLAIGSLPIFIVLILYSARAKLKSRLKKVFIYTSISLFIPLPWFFRSYLINGNPVYPFLTQLYPLGSEYHTFTVVSIVHDTWELMTAAPDPVSPLYLIALPLIIAFLMQKSDKPTRVVSIYSALSLLIWYFLPRVGGGRFILPYLPAFSFLTMYAVKSLMERKMFILPAKIVTLLVILYAFVFIFYRSAANAKYLAYITGQQSKGEFLSQHLNFSYGDFYDTDEFFRKTIKKSDTVLLIGFHNLYYADFPFIDQSYVKKGDTFNYIAVQNTSLPQRFNNWNLIYSNPLTHVSVYSTEGMKWVY